MDAIKTREVKVRMMKVMKKEQEGRIELGRQVYQASQTGRNLPPANQHRLHATKAKDNRHT